MMSRYGYILISVSVALLSGRLCLAQFREEMATLENVYEARARSVLNTILRPFEYSVVVAVDIERDEGRLAKIQETYEKNYLPGMPGAGSLDSLPVSNQLHEIKNRVDIHLVLAPSVPTDKEETLKALIKLKLHLNEENGDSVTVARANLPAHNTDEPAPSKLPELSWKMWILILILALIALAGVLLLIAKRNSQAKPINPDESAAKEGSELDEVLEVDSNKAGTVPIEIDPHELLFEQKRQLMSYVSQYPEASIRALTDHFQKGHESDVVYMCEAYGWELAKKMFAGFSPRIWGKIGHTVAVRKKTPTANELQSALENCHRAVLARYLELGDRDHIDPFSFVWKLSPHDRRKLLDSESPFSLALVCIKATQDQMADLLTALSEDQQEAVTIQIAKLKNIPQESIRMSSDLLLKKLKAIEANPEIQLNGSAMAAELLRSLPPEKEIQFFEKLRLGHPEDADRVRRTLLMYADVIYVPNDIITELGSMLEINVFAQALRLGFPDVRDHILKSLPPKRAAMILQDLDLEVPHFTIKEAALAQREIAVAAMALLRARGLELDTIIPKQSDQLTKEPEAA